MNEIILFFFSTLPVFLVGLYIYKKDKNKEPSKLLVKLFIGGIFSCFMVLILSTILSLIFPFFSSDYNTLDLFQLFIYVFIGIALVEEICKWFVVYKISYNEKSFEEKYDMIVYSAFVALGFAFFENLLYVYDGGIKTGIIRALLAVPGHACDGIFMGYYLAMSKKFLLNDNQKEKNKYLVLSILVPTIMHGFYDYCLFSGEIILIILFFIFVIFIYIFSIKKIKKISNLNRKMKYYDNYCPNCGHKVESNYCPNCGRKNN